MVGALNSYTGLPASIAAAYEATLAASTPMTWHRGLMALIAKETPAMSPAPPMGTITTSTSLTCSMISMPIVPAPAMISGSS